eukprot:m51a1_g2596 hypothetical protein (479) ;mRNA; r:447544-449696
MVCQHGTASASVRYSLRAVFWRPWLPDFTAQREVIVMSPEDSGPVPGGGVVACDGAVAPCETCGLNGPVEVRAALPRAAWRPGDLIPVAVSIRNRSSRVLPAFCAHLCQVVTVRGGDELSPTPGARLVSVLSSDEGERAYPRGSIDLVLRVQSPAGCTRSFSSDQSGVMSLDYAVIVEMRVSGCSKVSVGVPVVISPAAPQAAVKSEPLFTLDSSRSFRNVEIPKNGRWEGQFVVTPAQIAMGANQIEFSFDFGAGNPGRQVTMNVDRTLAAAESSPAVSKKFKAVFSLNTDTYTFDLTSVNCSKGCTLYFSLNAECPLEVCVHSVTSNFWARLQNTTGAYMYGITKDRPIELTTDMHSPDITLKKGARNYFTYTPQIAATMPVEWYVDAFSSIAVGGSVRTWNDPQDTTEGGFIQLHNREKRNFIANQKTYWVVELASSFGGDDTTYRVCIGPECNSGAAAVVVSFASLLSALALFF